MYISPEVAEILRQACALAENARYEYVTPELVLYAACRNKVFAQAFQNCDGSVKKLDFQLKSWLEENMEKLPVEEGEEDSETTSDIFRYLCRLLPLGQGIDHCKVVVEIVHGLCVIGKALV